MDHNPLESVLSAYTATWLITGSIAGLVIFIITTGHLFSCEGVRRGSECVRRGSECVRRGSGVCEEREWRVCERKIEVVSVLRVLYKCTEEKYLTVTYTQVI